MEPSPIGRAGLLALLLAKLDTESEQDQIFGSQIIVVTLQLVRRWK
jgi:hypothetical protein